MARFFKIKQDLSIKRIADEFFIFDRSQSHIHTFNETGYFFWQLIEEGLHEDDMIRRITMEYDASTAEVKKDLQEFLMKLTTRGIIEEHNDSKPGN